MAEKYPSTYKEMYVVPPEVYNDIYGQSTPAVQHQLSDLNVPQSPPKSQYIVPKMATSPPPSSLGAIPKALYKPPLSSDFDPIKLSTSPSSSPTKGTATMPGSSMVAGISPQEEMGFPPRTKEDVMLPSVSRRLQFLSSDEETPSPLKVQLKSEKTKQIEPEKSKHPELETSTHLEPERSTHLEPEKSKDSGGIKKQETVRRNFMKEVENLKHRLKIVQKICLDQKMKQLQKKKNISQSVPNLPLTAEMEELFAIEKEIQNLQDLPKPPKVKYAVTRKRKNITASPYKPPRSLRDFDTSLSPRKTRSKTYKLWQ